MKPWHCFWITLSCTLFIYNGVVCQRSVVDICCNFGREWHERNNNDCPLYNIEQSIPDVPFSQQDSCRSVAHVCCLKELMRDRCNTGAQVAKTQQECKATLRIRDGGLIISECCHCCTVGITAKAAGLPCTMMSKIDRLCDIAFRSCCNGAEIDVTTVAPPTIDPNDIDECSLFPNQLCSHICRNTQGSFVCECRNGFQLNPDGKTCRPVEHGGTDGGDTDAGDGADTGGGVVDPQNPDFLCTTAANLCEQLCHVESGNIVCSCRNGFRLLENGRSCVDIDECILGTQRCRSDQTCQNNIGGYRCISDGGTSSGGCPSGFQYNRLTGRCETRVPVQCPGGFVYDSAQGRCVRVTTVNCPAGTQYNTALGNCDDIDECELRRHSCTKDHQSCRNTLGSYICQCDPGFSYNIRSKQCEDLNECALNQDDCIQGQNCENTIGSYVCTRSTSCGTGYTLNKDNQQCVDDDECTLETHNCGNAFTCNNIPGSFRCKRKECPQGYKLDFSSGICELIVCNDGYEPERSGRCVDKDECQETPSPCHRRQTCVNTVGSYRCRDLLNCGSGYKINDAGNRCIDIDECVTNGHDCIGNQVCQNRPGTFICQCPTGYEKNPITKQCQDINECDRYRGQVCALRANCVNTEGSYTCVCKEGFRSAGDGRNCIDVNECERQGTCQHNCVNSWGSFQCICNDGYELSPDGRTCIDIDECKVWGSRGRLCSGICENIPGSYKCSCPGGYRLDADGKTCKDIDECTEASSTCRGLEQFCFNTRGDYKCLSVKCPTGFVRTGDSNPSDNSVRCQRQSFVCPQGDEECLNAPLSFSYNFITFPENIRIPSNLFTMRGPASPFRNLEFELDLVSSRDPFTGARRVSRDFFYLNKVGTNQAVVRLLRDISAPQDIELELKMHIYSNTNTFHGTALAKIYIFVTKGDIY